MTDAQKIAQAKSWLEIEKNLGIKKGKLMSVAEADEQKANPNYNVDKSYRKIARRAPLLICCGFGDLT